MRRQNIRVIVASEYSETRSRLKEMVERQGGVIVGQAPDASKALTLVRHLKPHVAIIDSCLPYIVSLHARSCTGGLDTAQTINQEAPGTKVVLLSNLDTALPDYAFARPDGMAFSIQGLEDHFPLIIRNMKAEDAAPKTVLLATVEGKAQEVVQGKPTDPRDMVILLGALSIALGWFLIIGTISPTIGVLLGLAGMTAVVLGYAAKYTQSLWRRLLSK